MGDLSGSSYSRLPNARPYDWAGGVRWLDGCFVRDSDLGPADPGFAGVKWTMLLQLYVHDTARARVSV